MSSPHPFYRSYGQAPATSPHPFNRNYDVGPSTVQGPLQPIPGGMPSSPQAGGGIGAGGWANIISGIGQGASSAIGTPTGMGGTKIDARERKRATLARLLANALGGSHSLGETKKASENELKDFKTQALQQAARGFVNALYGSTKKG